MGGGGSLIHRITNRNIKKGNLVKIRKKVPKYQPPKWQDLTYKSKEITPHIKSEQRGKKVVTKTTYHSVKNPDNLSKRKLKKQFEAGNTQLHTNFLPQTFITQKKKTKYHDSKRWNDEAQDRKKKEITHTTGQTLASQKKDSSYDKETTYRSKSKHLRANKEGQAIVKKRHEDDGMRGLKNVRIRGKVTRQATNVYKNPECDEPFGYCPNHADGVAGTMGNKPLKTTHVRTFKKGTSADDAFAGRMNPSGSPRAMNEMIGHSIKKIKGKSYGDKKGTQSIVGHPDGKAPQYKSNRGKVNKKKIKFHDRSTLRLKQNIFNDSLAQSHSPVHGMIKAKDFRQLKRDHISGKHFKNWKETGKIRDKRIANKD